MMSKQSKEIFTLKKNTVRFVGNQLEELNRGIRDVLKPLEFDSANIAYEDKKDPEEMFLRDEYQRAVHHLEKIHYILEYLKKPIVAEGHLYKNSNGRYELDDYNEFTSGSTIEFFTWDKWDETDKWVAARVEHTNGDYYIYGHQNVPLEGLLVRKRK